jgi:hypothetical protein
MTHFKLPVSLNARGAEVKELHSWLSRLGSWVPKVELAEGIFGTGTREALIAVQKVLSVPITGILDELTQAALGKAVIDTKVPEQHVQGRIVFDRGDAAVELPLRVYDRGFGDIAILLAEGKTRADGTYDVPYVPCDAITNLEVRAVAANGEEVPLSGLTYSARPTEQLNLVAPSKLRHLAPEHDRIREDLKKHLGTASLGSAREDDHRQDITLLHRATDWDARLIALAVTADKNASITKIPVAGLYALYRAGLPTDVNGLARVPEAVVEHALERAARAGIISANEPALTRSAFAAFVSASRRGQRASGALSTLGELLARSGLDAREQSELEHLIFSDRGAPSELWNKAAQVLPGEKVEALKLQGKLSYLTLNNAPLAESLQKLVGSSENLHSLVDAGLYDREAWKARISEVAGGESKVGSMIPPAYRGPIGERLDAYAEDLARKVRMTYPTRVIAQKISKDELRLGKNHASLKHSVIELLGRAVPRGFELGTTPLGSFLREHVVPTETARVMKRLQRLYQITPDDRSLEVLLGEEFDSAAEVTAIPRDEFLARFGEPFGSTQSAALVYRKAQQVDAVLYNVFAAAKQLDLSPTLFAISSNDTARRQAKDDLIRRFPTLERLFGSQDFCECEHCRSVLSPAAYFVDLLKFLDPDLIPWEHFLRSWKARHAGADYTEHYLLPYDALTIRRPDLPHIPLTCENINTMMPYIDLVNEILEYFVAHGRVEAEAAHDTGEAASADLVAEPQYIEAHAYQKLHRAVYPLNLPFDLWLETARDFLDHFEVPLAEVLEVFRPTNELLAPDSAGPGEHYYRIQIFAESLGLSPAELSLLTKPKPLESWFSLYGYRDSDAALTALRSAKTLSKRLGVSYKELVELVKTSFVNPKIAGLSVLERLGMDLGDVFGYMTGTLSPGERSTIEASLTRFDRRYSPFQSRGWLTEQWQEGTFADALVLHDSTAACNFDETELCYADGHPASPLDFLKLNLFVRLWKRLGWSIEELDRSLGALLPHESRPITASTIGRALETAVIRLAQLEALHRRFDLGNEGRLRLLTLWSDLPTTGKSSLYARLFLSPSVAKIDPVFDHPVGNYLSTPGVLLKDHLTALQAALTLTAEEIERILNARGLAIESAELRLPVVSMLHRYFVLARALGLPIKDLIGLIALSGLDPFSETVDFVELAQKVRESGFSVESLEYLLAHEYDPAGPQRPDPNAAVSLMRALGTEIRRIRSEHAVPSDETLSDEGMRRELALVLPPDAADAFMAILEGSSGDEAQLLIRRLGPGLLDSTDVDALAIIGGDRAERRGLLARRLFAFVEQTLVRRAIVETVSAHLASEPSLSESLITDPELLEDPSSGRSLADAFARAAERGLTASYWTTSSPSGTPRIATAATASTRDAPAGTLSAKFEGRIEVPRSGEYRFSVLLERPGAWAILRIGDLPNPVVSGTRRVGDDPELSGVVQLRAGASYSVVLEVADLAGGLAELTVQGETMEKGALARLSPSPQESLQSCTRARALLTSALRITTGFGLSPREVRLLARDHAGYAGLPLGRLPTAASSEAEARFLFARFIRVADYVRLKKALAVTNDDLVEILEHARIEHAADHDPSRARDELLSSSIERLSKLTRRKTGLISDSFGVLRIEASTSLEGGKLVARAPALSDERELWRLWRVLAVAERLGVPVRAVARWTEIVSPRTTRERAATLARELKDTVKARYDAERWRQIAQPIFDRLRRKQRDALVAHIMHKEEFDRIEELFEYLLIDPGMEPVVQTSRIQLAIASVQLFVQRCLLSLEKRVPPAAIDAKRWEVMRAYRRWEANRKIFLYPEVWLEPELRDDKSFLFRELEGVLLQGDANQERAEGAFLQYLKRLESISRLEIAGTYVEESKHDRASNVLHVIGRTFDKPYEYYYRKYAHRTWTPWEPMPVEIEGDHVTPVIWRDRLHVFWVTFLERPASDGREETTVREAFDATIGSMTSREVAVQLHWSELYQGQWAERRSSELTRTVPVGESFDPSRVFLHVSKEVDGERDRSISVHVSAPVGIRFRLVSKSGRPEMDDPVEILEAPPYSRDPNKAYSPIRYFGRGALEVTFTERIVTEDGQPPSRITESEKILRLGPSHSLLFPSNRLEAEIPELAPVLAPFFYEDTRRSFLVEPSVTVEKLDRWEGWVITPGGGPFEIDLDWVKKVPIEVQVPRKKPWPIVDPGDPWFEVDDRALHQIRRPKDWVIDPATRVSFQDRQIARSGGAKPSREK